MTDRRRQPDDALMQRISSAIDADGGVDADAELRALLDRDADALLYAQDLVRIDEVLRDLGERAAEPDWDALASRIDASLDREDLADLEGFDTPPAFLDADAVGSATRPEASRAVARGDVSGEVAVAASAPRASDDGKEGAKVVDLASRPRRTVFAWTGGLAAAAAVGLGIAFGTVSFDAAPSEAPIAYEPAAEATLEPSAQAVAPAPAMPEEAPGAWDRVAEAEPAEERALAAAGAAEPVFGGTRGAAPAPSPAPPPMRLERAREPRAEVADSTGAPRPSRAQVLSSLHAVEPRVQRCLADVGEIARVTLQVGVGGNVISTRVDPPYTGADAACIVDALRTAQLSPSPEGYVFVHVFRPAPVAGGSLARPPNAARARRSRPAQRAETPAEPEVVDAFSE